MTRGTKGMALATKVTARGMYAMTRGTKAIALATNLWPGVMTRAPRKWPEH